MLAKADPKKRYYFHAGPTASNLAIPAGDGNAEVVSEVTLAAPGRLIYAQPHMHLRGKDMDIALHYPTGESETILSVPRYDFSWQTIYFETKPRAVPQGTRVELTAHWDNSANNKYNPNPRNWVGYGQRSIDEMSFAWITLTYLEEPDFQQRVQARASK